MMLFFTVCHDAPNLPQVSKEQKNVGRAGRQGGADPTMRKLQAVAQKYFKSTILSLLLWVQLTMCLARPTDFSIDRQKLCGSCRDISSDIKWSHIRMAPFNFLPDEMALCYGIKLSDCPHFPCQHTEFLKNLWVYGKRVPMTGDFPSKNETGDLAPTGRHHKSDL